MSSLGSFIAHFRSGTFPLEKLALELFKINMLSAEGRAGNQAEPQERKPVFRELNEISISN